ncbi:MAG TPA: TetR/AcrR family transcriptional regulator [Anaeromyxobacter sp.]
MGKGEETRGAILERAIQLASEVGLEGLTIGRLAGALDLSKSGLFAHFASKEGLQIATLERAAERFGEVVLRPAFKAPRGEPRLRALVERWLRWPIEVPQPGGCIFVQAAVELDDRPGPARERLVALQREWVGTLAAAVRGAVAQGHFRRDVDAEQVAFELYGIMLSTHHASRLLGDPRASTRACRALERLLASCRTPPA